MSRAPCWAMVFVVVVAGCGDDGTTPGTTPAPDVTVDVAQDATRTTDGQSMTDADAALDVGDEAPADAALDVGDEARADAGPDQHQDHRVADAPHDMDRDALVCGANEVVAYNRPGCGDQAPAPYCQGPTDACLTPVCGCDGVTTASGCGFGIAPFAAWGACPDAGVKDASDDRFSDASEDVFRDAPTDVPADALVCGPSQVVAYKQPGCGAQTPPPYCQGVPDDACITPVCSCTGHTTGACGWSLEPFAHWGSCEVGPPDSGAPD